MTQAKLNLDHVVVVVSNLEQIKESFESLGFTVSLGGQNGPTDNALIAFQDGTYIELIHVRSRLVRLFIRTLYSSGILSLLKPFATSLSLRIFDWLGGPSGFRDWCLRTKSLKHTAASLTELHIPLSKAQRFTRTKPNQEVVQWLLAAPQAPDLPFMIEDLSHIDIRIPSGDAAVHANGILGISSLILREADYSESTTNLRNILGIIKSEPILINQTKVIVDSLLTSRMAIELIGPHSKTRVLEINQKEKAILMNSTEN